MPEIDELSLSHKELLELLIKHSDVHDGIWTLSITFGIGVGNFGPDKAAIYPGVNVVVSNIGIKRVPHGQPTNTPGEVTVDAAIVNPKRSAAQKLKKAAKG